MAFYDLLMLTILVGLTLYGYFKGMAWQVAYVASFVASYFVAVRFADQMAPQITSISGVGAPANKFIAMAVIYAFVSFGVWMLFRVVRKAIDSIKMEGFDHQMGAILGFGRGVLWCVGVTFLTLTVLPFPEAWKQQAVNSQSGYYIARLIDETESVFPPEVHQVIDPYLSRLGNELGSGQTGPPSSGAAPSVWPGSATQPTAQPAAPAWGQSAGNQNASPQWPASTDAPPTPAWPSGANQPPAAQPSASNFGWPTSPGQAPATTPAQPASWPEWNR